MTTMEDVPGVTTSTYDSISRKVTVTNPANKTITYAYGAVGVRSAMTDPDGGRFTYSYNADGQLETLVNPQNDRTTYSYDAQGRRDSMLLANSTRTSFTFDANSQLTNVVHRKSDNTVINSFAYTYDAAGNRVSITEASGDRTTYTYDVTNQIASEHRTGNDAHRTTFTYDASGNRIKHERDAILIRYEYDTANQITAQIDGAGTTTYTFDSAGNQQVILEPNGDLTTTTWNYENQPTVYEKPDNSLVTMTYNAENRRVNKESTILETKFIWEPNSDNVLLETNDFDTTQVVYTNEPEEFGSLISQRRGSITNWFHFDALGSTNNLTNSSETITDSYAYDAWGNKLSSSGTTTNPFQYVGEYGYYFDAETGISYIRARVYQPTIGRWASADPLGFADGLDMYLYAANNPMIMIDPGGLLKQRTLPHLPPEIDPIPIPFPNPNPGSPFPIFIPLLIPQLASQGECGKFDWRTEWILRKSDTDGLIVQTVNDGLYGSYKPAGRAKNCENPKTPPKPILRKPQKGDPVLNSNRCGLYIELWRVYKGEVYSHDVTKKVPKNRSNYDAFTQPGYTSNTKGKLSKRGTAFFVPWKHVIKYLKDIDRVFGTGTKGVAGAGLLTSACINNDSLRIRGLLERKKEGRTTKKEAVVRWNCCCEKDRRGKNKLNVTIDKKESFQIGPIKECPSC